MDDCGNRRWDELNPEALGVIFRTLSLEEILVVIPCVCKSWRKTVLGPYCWREMDIINWCEHRHRLLLRQHLDPDVFNRFLQTLITRSAGSLHKLAVSCLPNDSSLALIAEHGKALQTLRIPASQITSFSVELFAKSFCGLTFLDLSFCPNIGATAVEAIGKNCVNLTSFLRVMHPKNRSIQDDEVEAFAVAYTMRKLKHLEMTNMLISTESLLEIMENCKELEYVDVRGCWNVVLNEKFKNFSKVKFVTRPLGKMLSEFDMEFDFSNNDMEDFEPDWFGSP